MMGTSGVVRASNAHAEVSSTVSNLPATYCRERRIGSSQLDSNDKISCRAVQRVLVHWGLDHNAYCHPVWTSLFQTS